MQIKELTKQYDGKTVVDGVTFSIPRVYPRSRLICAKWRK